MRPSLPAAAFALALAAPGVAAAQPAEEAIRNAISGQISAFTADDLEAAYAFASPGIKRRYPNARRFGRMVRAFLPMVWRPAEVRFIDLSERAGRIVQSLMLIDERGAFHVLDYEMVEGEAGWQVDRIRARRPSDAGA